jgi:hypothetical protein
MKSYEWNLSTKSFNEVDDPTYNADVDSVDEAIANAGYKIQLSSDGEEAEGGFIRVYTTDVANKPQFYIEIMGLTEGIASLVAHDFPSLVETLRQIHPIIALIGLDQFSSARVTDEIKRKYGSS